MTLELLKSQTGRTSIESHRGVKGNVPENSWSAIQLGHRLGADLIEVDVQMSRDSVPFLHHNYQLRDGRWCHDLSWEELQEIKMEGEPLPKLEDVLAWARHTNVYLSLDLKTFFRPEGNLAKEVFRLLEKTNTKDKVLLLFWDHQELFHTKLAHPELTVRALLTGRLLDYSRYLREIKADCVSISYGILRPEDIEQIHSIDKAVVLIEYWNQSSDLLKQFDIDVLSCDNPAEAKEVLNRQ